MHNIRVFAQCLSAFCSGAILLCLAAPARGSEASAKAKLAEKGIRASRSGISLVEEAELAKAVSTAGSLKRKFLLMMNQQQTAEYVKEEADAQVQELLQDNVILKKRYAQINRRLFPLRNEIAQQINTNESEIALILETQNQSTKGLDELRQSANSAREKYVQQVLNARTLADRLAAQYAELSKDQEVVAAVTEWDKATGTSQGLKPSRTFESTLKRLEILEKKILSEKIPLRHEGNSYYATVMINGKQTCEMIVDTGASIVLLPYQVAVDAGVNVDGATETITGQIANGAKIQLKHVMLNSVRVGKFTAENVSCGVLPANSASAKPLLGMTFLGRFKFELNANASELSLLRVDADAPAAQRKKKATPKRPVKKLARPAPSSVPQE